MSALPTYLVRIGATYKFRSRIPHDLLGYYQPKKEITESLHTKSLADAKRLLPAVQLKHQQHWANLRAALKANITELALNDATIQYLTACFEHESLSGDEQTRLEGNYTLEEIQDYRQRLSESITFLRDAAAVGDLEVIRPALDQYLHLKRIKVTGSEADYRAKGVTIEIEEYEFRQVVENPSLYYFSTALKLHCRIERATAGEMTSS